MRVLIDLFCGAGGCTKGYQLAGFYIIGVDLYPQPKYIGNEFYQDDAFSFLDKNKREFYAIHASPPCQLYSQASNQWKNKKEYPDYIDLIRQRLIKLNIYYIIENVPHSPLINPIFLNGYMFNLLVHRPRLFECNFDVIQPEIKDKKLYKPIKMGRKVNEGEIIQPVGNFIGVKYAQKAMEIDWMNQKELAQAIPPKYTEYIGKFIK